MRYEITFKPAGKRKGERMAYVVEASNLIEAGRTARRYVEVEAPGYMLESYREIAA